MYIPIHKYIHFVISLLCIKLYFYNSKMSFQLPIEIEMVYFWKMLHYIHIYIKFYREFYRFNIK